MLAQRFQQKNVVKLMMNEVKADSVITSIGPVNVGSARIYILNVDLVRARHPIDAAVAPTK